MAFFTPFKWSGQRIERINHQSGAATRVRLRYIIPRPSSILLQGAATQIVSFKNWKISIFRKGKTVISPGVKHLWPENLGQRQMEIMPHFYFQAFRAVLRPPTQRPVEINARVGKARISPPIVEKTQTPPGPERSTLTEMKRLPKKKCRAPAVAGSRFFGLVRLRLRFWLIEKTCGLWRLAESMIQCREKPKPLMR